MGRSPCCSKEGLKRGPWSAKEDALLSNFIMQNGEGQWRSLPNKAGLLRCGKSCRLRWMNYLRPGIKRGNISQDEEDLIVRLHGLLGNRWSLIAGRLPGRTDNEIKNYWNTHLLKKLTTAGLLPKPHRIPPKPVSDKKKRKPKAEAEAAAAAAAAMAAEEVSDVKIERIVEKSDPPKTKVYSPKPMRVSPGFSRSSSYDSWTSGPSSSDGGEKAAAAVAEVASYSWQPFFEAGDGKDEDDFLGAGSFLPLLRHQLQLDSVAGGVGDGDAVMLDKVYDEYLQLL